MKKALFFSIAVLLMGATVSRANAAKLPAYVQTSEIGGQGTTPPPPPPPAP